MKKRALFWFTRDLRLSDNASLLRAAADSGHLLCIYCVDPAWFVAGRYGLPSMGKHRWQFLQESLNDLKGELKARRQHCLVLHKNPVDAIEQQVRLHGIEAVYRSQLAGVDERHQWLELQKRLPDVAFVEVCSHTLLAPEQLPFELKDLPETFTQFRKKVESIPIEQPLWTPDILPPPIPDSDHTDDPVPPSNVINKEGFAGGASAGKKHLERYFSKELPQHYKEVRNELDGWEHSTKFSSWLANGSLSVREIYARIKQYENDIAANESTYWIIFELLWREYFQWYAHRHGIWLFAFAGIKNKRPLTSFYASRFKQWCEGSTPFPIVNACMKQLNETGYMSNRGRQLVASCLVHELSIDWRYGAAYFEEKLIDYDVGSNWGNWQYLAGVGADPRGHRHFDLEKQAKHYDPHGVFVRRWKGDENCIPLDWDHL